MATLREYLNAKIKAKGSSMKAEKAKASKYKSIAAAKKAGALYYTNKNGKVMAAVYAEDLKKPIKKSSAPKTSTRPKARPKASSAPSKSLRPKARPSSKPKTADQRRAEQLDSSVNKPGNEAAKKAREEGKLKTIAERAAERKKKKANK